LEGDVKPGVALSSGLESGRQSWRLDVGKYTDTSDRQELKVDTRRLEMGVSLR
jgi:hypothetical protein